MHSLAVAKWNNWDYNEMDLQLAISLNTEIYLQQQEEAQCCRLRIANTVLVPADCEQVLRVSIDDRVKQAHLLGWCRKTNLLLRTLD